MPATLPVPLLAAQPVDGVVAGKPLSGSIVADQPFQLTRFFSGAGAPSSSTLFAATAAGEMTCNGKYLVNDLYFDTAASALYRCTTAGTNAVGSTGGSAWAKISGGGGSNWQSPRELDPTRAVPAGTKVFITPDNPIITTGIVDRGSGTLTMAQTGIWEAAVTVPAKALDGAIMKYHVPQFPYPGAGGYSAGPPVTGGLDAPTMFWIYWGALNC